MKPDIVGAKLTIKYKSTLYNLWYVGMDLVSAKAIWDWSIVLLPV